MLLYYLNSGYYRFEQYQDYTFSKDGTDINSERLLAEVQDEVLTDVETAEKLKSFFSCHSTLDAKLMSCGCCGLRMLERPRDPVISYHQISSPLMDLLKLDETGMAKLSLQKRLWGDQDIMVNAQGGTAKMDLWEIWSLYSAADGKFFHLHPE